MKPIALVTVNVRFRKSSSGRIGSAALRSTNANATSESDADDHQRDDLNRVPRPRRAAEAREEHDRREAAREQRRAEVVDLVADVHGGAVERGRDHAERERAQRQVDVEDPAPREVVDEEAAEQRPDHGRDAEDGAEEPLVLAALARRHDVADHRHAS